MKNKILKPLTGLMLLAVMALTFTMNSDGLNQNDTSLDNIIALNQAQAEKTHHCFSCDDDYPTEVCYTFNGVEHYGRYSNEPCN